MRIVFAGTPDFAAAHLRYLLDQNDHDIVAVYTQPDRPAGRGKKISASPVKELAIIHNLPIYQPQTLRDVEAQYQLTQLYADVMVVVAYGLILPKTVLETPRYGCINVHASLLPRWRGAAPIQRAIEAGDTQTGITIMQMDEGLDTGDMLMKHSCTIAPEDTGGTLHDKLLALGGPALHKVLHQIETHTGSYERQDDAQSNYAHKINKAEAKLDWQLSAEQLERKIRAFNPFPVAFFDIDGSPVRVWEAKTLNEHSSARPGTVVNCDKNGIKISTSKNILLLQCIQMPGKKPLPVKDILNGNSNAFPTGLLLS